MSPFESVINFLEERLKKAIKNPVNVNNKRQSTIKTISKEINAISEQQELINSLLNEMVNISIIKSLCKQNIHLKIEEELDTYFDSLIKNIFSGATTYSFSFPFYGYKPFTEKLRAI